MKIDTHSHLFSPGLAQEVAKYTPYNMRIDRDKGMISTFLGLQLPILTEEERIAEMEKMGIDAQIISVRTAALLSWEELSASLPLRLTISQIINDYLASVCQRYSDRFMAYADISLSLGDEATKEMIRSLDDLHLHGVSLLTNYDGRYLDAPEFQSFFEEANRRGVVIFVHPTYPPGKQGLMDWRLYAAVGFPYETTLTFTRMAFSGFLERFPYITFIMSHLGGAIPFLWQRICRPGRVSLPEPVPNYLKRCYYDTAISDTESLMLAYYRVGDHLMLGTDHPFIKGDVSRTVAAIEAMDVPVETKAKILGGNALTLLRKSTL